MKTFDDVPEFDLILVDAMNLVSRMHYALNSLSYRGKPTGMQYGVMKQAFNFRSRYGRAKILFLWEGMVSKRKSLNADYKANREAKKEEFHKLVRELRLMLNKGGFDSVYHTGLEADDLAGYYVAKEKEKGKILLVSNDKDWLQYLEKNRVYVQRKAEVETYEELEKEFGFPPNRINLWKIIKGDKVDNIKGIKGFREDAAKVLVNHCETLDDLKKFPLAKHDPRWYKWETAIKANWKLILDNNGLITYNPSWINKKEIVWIGGAKDYSTLRHMFIMKGMQELVFKLKGMK